MLEVLKLFNYTPPNIQTIDRNGFKVITDEFGYRLFINNEQWMMYDWSHTQAAMVYSHYHIAYGDVITTGLGFAARESWLLNNPRVKSLTVLEKNQCIIDYHKEINSDIIKKAKVICTDAVDYVGKCDTLLLDHYEHESMDYIVNNVKTVCKNIQCEKMWYWHLETQILADLHGVQEDGVWLLFRDKKLKFDTESLRNIKYVYENIRQRFNLEKLPNLTEEELKLFLTIYTGFYNNI